MQLLLTKYTHAKVSEILFSPPSKFNNDSQRDLLVSHIKPVQLNIQSDYGSSDNTSIVILVTQT